MTKDTVRAGDRVLYVLTLMDAALINSEKHHQFRKLAVEDVIEVSEGETVEARVCTVYPVHMVISIAIDFDAGQTYFPRACRYGADNASGTWHLPDPKQAPLPKPNPLQRAWFWLQNLTNQ